MPATTTFNANTIRVNNNLEVGLTADISGNVTIHGTSTFKNTVNANTILPNSDGNKDLGSSNNRWQNIYATNGVIQTSDRNFKKDIEESDLGLTFIENLKPVKYKIKEKNILQDKYNSYDTGGVRTHYGLISQDVRDCLKKMGKKFDETHPNRTNDFAGYCASVNSAKTEYNRFSLRYEEFISPMIKSIQELSEKVAEQQAEIDNLKSQINN
tara:strand:- start:11169 stop:11804 length:636 start_codon:yes stop_codon:yes gene_type:complete